MDPERPLTVVRVVVAHIPFFLYTVVAHVFSISPTSRDWDLLTELSTKFLRSVLNTSRPNPLSKTQAISTRDPGIKGRMWVAKVTLPKPEDSDVLEKFGEAFEALRTDPAETTGKPEMADGAVEAEWTGYRRGVSTRAAELRISEEEKYSKMMAEVKNDVTILYLHGGAYYLLDPATHREATTRLAHYSGGRCLSIRYRLAPQNPFPAALLDAFVAYMSLIYPPPSSLHSAVPASSIVVTGDSAGGGLSFALLQWILALRNPETDEPGTMRWYGKTVSVPLPAGIAANSAWLDTTHALPSVKSNAHYDYLPLPLPRVLPPPCDIWPVNPPRCNIYANDSCLLHPLVSPLTARSWAHAPPLFMMTGEEMLTDETLFLAARAANQGVPVILEQYKAMPHCFGMLYTWLATSRRSFVSWADFCRRAVEDPASLQTKGTRIPPSKSARGGSGAGAGAESSFDVSSASALTLNDVLDRMRAARQQRIEIISAWAHGLGLAPAKARARL